MSWRPTLEVWYRNFLVWRRNRWISGIEAIGEPILYFVGIGYGLGAAIGDIDGRPYIEFIAPALIATAIMFGASLETTYGSFTRLKIEKIFQSIAVTPVSLTEVVAGELAWGATKGLVSGGVMFLLIWALGLTHSWLALAMVPLFLLEALFFSALGLLVTAYARDYGAFVIYITLGLEPMFLFSGTFFPLSLLPSWAENLAWALPLTAIVAGARQLFDGTASWVPLLVSIALFAIALLIAVWSTARISKRLIL